MYISYYLTNLKRRTFGDDLPNPTPISFPGRTDSPGRKTQNKPEGKQMKTAFLGKGKHLENPDKNEVRAWFSLLIGDRNRFL